MKTYRNILSIVLLALSLPVLAEAEPGAEAAYNARHQTSRYRTQTTYRYSTVRRTYRRPNIMASEGWGLGFSVNEYFGDFEYFGDLIPVYSWSAAKWAEFGKGIGRNLGVDIHASYFRKVNETVNFRANFSLNLLRGTHYVYDVKPDRRNEMSGASFMSAGLGLHAGVELFPDREVMNLYFYLGGAAMTTLQFPKFHLGDNKYQTFYSAGVSPMLDLGVGYIFSLNKESSLRVDLQYAMCLLDYGSEVHSDMNGKWGFTSSLDGVPGKYVRGLNEDGTYDLINCGYHPGDAAQTWLQFSSNGKAKRVRWPDSIFSVRFTFTLPNTDSPHRSSSARGIIY